MFKPEINIGAQIQHAILFQVLSSNDSNIVLIVVSEIGH